MNLHSKHLKTLQTLFSKYPAITQAILFGSRALGTHKESSDIDIALKGDITPTLLAHLKEELEDSTLPYFCDILDYERAPQELKEHIDIHALTLYKREEEWQEVRLGDMVEINKNNLGKNFEYENILYLDTGSITRNQISLLQTFHISNAPSRAKRLLGKRNIVYSMVRPIQRHFGFIENPPKNLVVSTGFVVIEEKENSLIDLKYLYYFLTLDEKVEFFESIAEGSTSTYPSLKPSDLAELTIPLPPLERQKEIAEILSSFDDKIDFLHRQNHTLESLAQTLFRHYFIENAKEEWEEKPLSEIATFLNGLACQKIPPKNDLDKLPVLKIKELREGKISETSDWATNEVEDRYIVNQGDIIFSWSATLMVEIWGGEKCVLNQHLFKVIADKGYPQWFCYFWCKYHLESFISIAKAHATTMGHIRRQDLDNAICRIPSQEFINKFDSEISPLMLKLMKNFKEVKDLEILHNKVLSTIFKTME